MSRCVRSPVQLHDVCIRRATLADAAAIAQVHVQAWHETYRTLVPEEMFDMLSVERNTRMWHDVISTAANVIVVAVRGMAESRDASELAIVGFGSAGRARDAMLGTDGEVSAIYLLDEVKRRGLGRRLFAELMQALDAGGYRSAGLWVLVDNAPARAFYAALGGQTGATREVAHEAAPLHEIAYVWDGLTSFR